MQGGAHVDLVLLDEIDRTVIDRESGAAGYGPDIFLKRIANILDRILEKIFYILIKSPFAPMECTGRKGILVVVGWREKCVVDCRLGSTGERERERERGVRVGQSQRWRRAPARLKRHAARGWPAALTTNPPPRV